MSFATATNYADEKEFKVTYPVEITLLKVENSIATGDEIPVLIKVKNTSKRDYGIKTDIQKSLALELKIAGKSNVVENITIKKNTQSQFQKTLAYAIDHLKAGESTLLKATLKAGNSSLPYTNINIISGLKLERHVNKKGDLTIIQENKVQISIAARYNYNPNAEALLITNSKINRKEYMNWVNLISRCRETQTPLLIG